VTIGFLGADIIDITKIGVTGGLILGPGLNINADGTAVKDMTEYRIDPGSNWTHHVYACVAAVKASIKTVELEMNGTALMSNLVVKNVKESSYGPGRSPPLWAVEDSGREMAGVSPFWGVVTDDMAGTTGIQTLQRPHLYLPAGASSAVGWGQLDAQDSVAGANVPFDVMSAIFDTSNLGESSGVQHIPPLTGKANWALYVKWAGLGPSAQSAAKITNYIVRMPAFANLPHPSTNISEVDRYDGEQRHHLKKSSRKYIREVAHERQSQGNPFHAWHWIRLEIRYTSCHLHARLQSLSDLVTCGGLHKKSEHIELAIFPRPNIGWSRCYYRAI